MNPISMDEYIKMHIQNNPEVDAAQFRAALEAAVKAKSEGCVCDNCDNPIWAIGTAGVGWNACFSCITGEADSSEDYEIDQVNF